MNIKMRPWVRRLLTRGIALIPAVIVIALTGSRGTYQLLILSQVILSLQLPFAIVPLIHFTSDPNKMGLFANRVRLKLPAWIAAAIIVGLNLRLFWEASAEFLTGFPLWLLIAVAAGLLLLIGVFLYISVGPFLVAPRIWGAGVISQSHTIAREIRRMEILHIGAALEHTAGDAAIISAAQSLAKLYKARLTLIHVVETPGTLALGAASDSLHSREDRAYLEDLAKEIEKPDLAVETWISSGNPTDEIIKSIEHLGLDMLVLGSHGHKGVEDLILGETVETVRHAIKIPVLIVRVPKAPLEKPQKSSD